MLLVGKNQIVERVLGVLVVFEIVLVLLEFNLPIVSTFYLFSDLSDGRVKSVFNLVFRSSVHVLSDLAPRLPELLVEVEDLFVVLIGPRSLLDLGIQYVTPAIPALGSRFVHEKFRCLLPLDRSPALHPVDKYLVFLVGPETASSFALLLLLDDAINVSFNPRNIIVIHNLIRKGINHIHALVVGELDFLSNLLFFEIFF